jgi:hypothetical protein
MPKPPAPSATSPFVDLFKAMAWEWRDLAEQRDRLRDEWDRCSADVEVEVARLVREQRGRLVAECGDRSADVEAEIDRFAREHRDRLMAGCAERSARLVDEIAPLDKAHWGHPIHYVFRRLEELLGEPWSDFEEAAWRINTGVGLAPLVRARGPGGVSGPDRRDLRHLFKVFRDLDEAGITTRLCEELRTLWPNLLTPSGATPAASGPDASPRPPEPERAGPPPDELPDKTALVLNSTGLPGATVGATGGAVENAEAAAPLPPGHAAGAGINGEAKHGNSVSPKELATLAAASGEPSRPDVTRSGEQAATPTTGKTPPLGPSAPAGEAAEARAKPDVARLPIELLGPAPASTLAKRLGQPVARVETFLRRYRKWHRDCCVQVTSRRKSEPQFLYRVEQVWPVLQQKLPEWEKLTDG